MIHFLPKSCKSSATRLKSESQNGCYNKKKHAKFSEKRIFLTPVCVSGGKKYSFFGKFGVFCFLVTPVLSSTFCLITDEM